MSVSIFSLIVTLKIVGFITDYVESSNLTSNYWDDDSVRLPDILKWKDNITLENSEFIILH